jgi:hypothetical protein
MAVVLLGAALAVSGCGSSSNADREKYSKAIASQLQGTNIPKDLAACVRAEADKLPLDQEKQIAATGNNPPAAAKKLAIGLITKCVSQGKGLSTLHQLIVQSIESSPATSSLPPAYKQCIERKAQATTPSQLSQLVAAYANGQTPAAQAQARSIGVGLAQQCRHDPAVLSAVRDIIVSGSKKAFESSTLSPAFKNCVIQKISETPLSKIDQITADPSREATLANALGRSAAHACLAAGIKP